MCLIKCKSVWIRDFFLLTSNPSHEKFRRSNLALRFIFLSYARRTVACSVNRELSLVLPTTLCQSFSFSQDSTGVKFTSTSKFSYYNYHGRVAIRTCFQLKKDNLFQHHRLKFPPVFRRYMLCKNMGCVVHPMLVNKGLEISGPCQEAWELHWFIELAPDLKLRAHGKRLVKNVSTNSSFSGDFGCNFRLFLDVIPV